MLPELPIEVWEYILSYTHPIIYTTVCKEWSDMCAPEGVVTVVVAYALLENDELQERAFRKLKSMAFAEVSKIETIKDDIAFALLCGLPPPQTVEPNFGNLILRLLEVTLKFNLPRHVSLPLELILRVLSAHPSVAPYLSINSFKEKVQKTTLPLLNDVVGMNAYSKSLVKGISRCLNGGYGL